MAGFGWTEEESGIRVVSDVKTAKRAIDAGMLLVAVAIPVPLTATIAEYKAAGALSAIKPGKNGKEAGGNGYYSLDAGPDTELPVKVRGMSLTVHGPLRDGTGRDGTARSSVRVAPDAGALAAFAKSGK